MSAKESFRVSPNLLKKIDRYTRERKITKSDLYVESLEHFFICKVVEPSFQLRLIALQYPSPCKICGTQLQEGAWAMYARGTGAICIECHQKKYGDKGSVRKFMKLYELDYTLRNLKEQCTKKAEELREFNLYEKMQAHFDANSELRQLAEKFYREALGDAEQEKELTKKIEAKIEEDNLLVFKVREFIQVPLTKKKRKRAVH